MGNLVNIVDFLQKDVELLLDKTQENSVFMSLAKKTPLTHGGKALTSIGAVQAGIVADRGGRKPVSEPQTKQVSLVPVEIAAIVPFHKDLEHTSAAAEVQVAAINSLALAFDEMVRTGYDAFGIPVPAVGFGHFGNTTPTPVASSAELYAVIAAASTKRHRTDAVLLSTGMFAKIKAAENQFGAPRFNISGDMDRGVINGLPYVTFFEDTEIGYVGAFSSAAYWGIVGGVSYDLLDQAVIDYNGIEYNLALQNMLAVRVSMNVGFNFIDPNAFRAITTAPAGS